MQSILSEGKNWFHGTQRQYAEDILQNGIKLGEGKPKLDFSHSWGFYLNKSFDGAKDWALKLGIDIPQYKLGSAVLIYGFTFQDFNNIKHFNGLDLTNNLENWQNTVKYYRSGMRYEISENLKDMLKRLFYITRVIAREPEIGQKIESWAPKEFHRSCQVCIKKERMARVVSLTLKSIIYLCK